MFSSLRDLSASDTLRDVFFLFAAGFAGACSCSPNENMARPPPEVWVSADCPGGVLLLEEKVAVGAGSKSQKVFWKRVLQAFLLT